MLAAKSARSTGRKAPASASSSARDNCGRTDFFAVLFLLKAFEFRSVCLGFRRQKRAVDHRNQNLSSRFAGSGWGINPERARWPRRMQFNKEVVWLISP